MHQILRVNNKTAKCTKHLIKPQNVQNIINFDPQMTPIMSNSRARLVIFVIVYGYGVKIGNTLNET